MQCRAYPRIIFVATEHMPGNDSELACYGDGSDVIAATTGDPFIERPQRPGAAHGLPCGFDKHGTSMSAALLGDPPMPRTTFARLVHTRVQAQISHQLVRAFEARDRPDRC